MKRVIPAGILLGGLAALSPGWFFIGLLAAGFALLLSRITGAADRKFVARLFLAGFVVRAMLSIGLDAGSCIVEKEFPAHRGPPAYWELGISDKTRGYLLVGDSDFYSARGQALVQYVRGSREPGVIYRLNQYGWNGYIDLIGLFYYVFGFSPSAVKGINCLLGAACGTLVFFLARDIFNRKIARWAAVGTAFFPSLLFWSLTNLKDIPFIFLTLLVILLFVRLIRAPGIRAKGMHVLYLALVLLVHSLVREVFFALLLAMLLLAALFSRWKTWPWLLLASAVPVGIFLIEKNPVVQSHVRAMLAQFFHKHIGYVSTPGISYLLFPVSFYVPAYLWEWVASGTMDWPIWAGLLKVPFHFFLEPLPWRFDSAVQMPALLQMVVWYNILFFAVWGVLSALKRRAPGHFYLLLPFLSFSYLIGLTNGNVGTLFRIRDLITPLLLIYAAVGLERFLRPERVRGSRLAGWFDRVRGRSLQIWNRWEQSLTEETARFVSAARSIPVRSACWIFLVTLLANSACFAVRNIEWTLDGLVFRLGLLALGLWGLLVRSDWSDLWQESRLAAIRRLNKSTRYSVPGTPC